MAVRDHIITHSDTQGRGLSDQPRFPQLKSPDMQRKFDELVLDVVMPKHNALVEEIDTGYATKLYVSERMQASGAGDMVQEKYDQNADGKVDEADRADRADNGVDEYIHEKTGTVHSLTGGSSVCVRFYALGDYAEGDTFTVEGAPFSAVTMDGAALPAGAFRAQTAVFCVKSGNRLVFPVGMPMSGGTFTGNAAACSTPRTGDSLMNISVENAEGAQQSSVRIVAVRK